MNTMPAPGHASSALNRRAFLQRALVTTALLSAPSVLTAQRNAPRETDAAILERVPDGIEKHRKGDGVIVVRGADGQPLPNVAVKIEQTRHDFLFGCNFFGFGRQRDPQLEDEYRRRFTALLNYATLPFYWASYEPRRGQPDYDRSERAAAWCREHSVSVKGHPLVWDHPASNPRWLPDDLEEVGRLSRARVTEIVARFKGRIDLWDVVNEGVHLGQANKEQRMGKWAATLGATKYVAEHLKLARAANPQATLLVNDYRLDPPYVRLLESLREDGRWLFDVIGLQSHMHGGGWPLGTVWSHCETFGKLGLPLHYTETTIVSGPRTGPGENWGPTTPELETKQADYVTKFYRTLFAHPAVQAITWWDFSDSGAWQRAAAGLVRKDMSPKPAYEQLHLLVKGDWWTKTQGRTNERGELAVRAFYGNHRLTAELPGGRTVTKDVRWERGQANRFELTAG
ncbi:MAG: endo-1,4-beta-xylanase [Verrucomicrobia bacterium]|nr:endo-1,4-beta-xylanase [Verrucomicrobiota bacterium]